ncbi:5-formyltetrahydrofolate cyclo-ligase [Massilia sp. G4R7]|uniref:5-formyltetrahydrofolate cyclo-ligase n=1 Tax=Massilia phyllostachyos TaxID=2898585 RepID=A0ABS8Q508_9BURK|nr:5-formyltetrahydrofolate cyclo-ligase [Massilia phyllostachyos]MCD2516840.1 5-formyltetrahydrofolate cyclo-ligase [Massilia phyllostachyos]
MTGDPRIPRAPGLLPDEGARHAPDKPQLRRLLKEARRAIAPPLKRAWDDRIGARVVAWAREHAVEVLGVYWPLAGEPDLRPAYAELAEAGVRLALPVVVARDAALGFAQWLPGEATLADSMGIAVPADLRMVDRPSALLIPCLGFDARGYRVGYGGGFYDRTLEAEPRPKTVGIAYACQQVDFEIGEYDIPLDQVITE